MAMLRRKRTHGQALVEFALAATLIFFLLSAVVDVGLIFFSLQGLHNAAQEGASYGSRWLVNGTAGARVLDTNKIIDRVRDESGVSGGIGFVNLHDLNADTLDDRTQFGYDDPNITIEMLQDLGADGDPTLDVASNTPESVPCTDASTAIVQACYIRVTVRSVHNMLFPFAPVFGSSVPLHSSYIMPIRDSVVRGNSGGSGNQTAKCVVPDLVGQTSAQATTLWAGQNFTGLLSFSGPANKPVQSQATPGGTILDCTQGITATRG
jgi:Flp pilus assembly protein TadG